jgi:hypothetical protein
VRPPRVYIEALSNYFDRILLHQRKSFLRYPQIIPNNKKPNPSNTLLDNLIIKMPKHEMTKADSERIQSTQVTQFSPSHASRLTRKRPKVARTCPREDSRPKLSLRATATLQPEDRVLDRRAEIRALAMGPIPGRSNTMPDHCVYGTDQSQASMLNGLGIRDQDYPQLRRSLHVGGKSLSFGLLYNSMFNICCHSLIRRGSFLILTTQTWSSG